jgi:hypothetical protein
MSLNCIASNRVPTARWLRRALMAMAVALAALPAAAQNQLWIEQFGKVDNDRLEAAAPDAVGGVYASGDSLGDPWLALYDGSGNLLWIHSLVQAQNAVAVAPDGSGGVYVGGYTNGNFGGPSAGFTDAWLARYDNAGIQLWARQFGTTGADSLFRVASDGSGGAYVGGSTNRSMGSGPNAGLNDAWFARYDGSGNQLWIRQIGTSDWDIMSAVSLAPNGVYVGGYTHGNLGGPNAGIRDIWLARYDGAGNQVWIRQFGTNDWDNVHGGTPDETGGVFITGSTDGNLGGLNAGFSDTWVARYDSAGNQVWIRQFGSIGGDDRSAIAPDGAGGVYLSGTTSGNLGGPNAGILDGWLARYDKAGNALWLVQFGTPEEDFADAVASDGSGGAFVGGITHGTLGGPSAGKADAWLARYDGECGGSPTYCTASSTSIAGCQASIGAAGSPSLSSPSSYKISSGFVPGGSFGICFFGGNGPASTPFGTLGGQICVQGPFYRSAPKQGGGSVGTCDGNYSFTLQDLINASPIVVLGAVIHAEIWARDTANPDGFLLSDGIQLSVCP